MGQDTGKRFQLDRLCQVSVETRVERALLVLRLPPTRDGDDRHGLLRRPSPDLPTGFIAIDAGQANIQEDDIRHGVLNGLQPTRRIMSNLRLTTQLLDEHCQRVCGIAIVIDDQDTAIDARHIR